MKKRLESFSKDLHTMKLSQFGWRKNILQSYDVINTRPTGHGINCENPIYTTSLKMYKIIRNL